MTLTRQIKTFCGEHKTRQPDAIKLPNKLSVYNSIYILVYTNPELSDFG